MNMPFTTMLKVMWTMLRGEHGRAPATPIPTVAFDRGAWAAIPDDQAAICWLGHSAVLIKIDGLTVLTDPVFGERASTFTFAGPKPFACTHDITVDQLPHIDVLLLSHDHYDHLGYDTIVALVAARKIGRVIAALGVGAHLEKWGVPPALITELEWWQQVTAGPLRLTFAPTRHFTGRTMRNRFSTLWGSFVLEGRTRRIYFGADSGYSSLFKELGRRFGRFDLALLECGAYSQYWPEIHMFPEQVVAAAKDLNAELLMPIHWGRFALGLHPWKEPIESVGKAAIASNMRMLTPRIGRIAMAWDNRSNETWWEGL